MGIKETPVNFRVYYKTFVQENKEKLAEATQKLDELKDLVVARHNDIVSWQDVYINQFNFDLTKYEEFINNTYTTGKFYRAAKSLFMNKQNDYEFVADLYSLFELANAQKAIHDITKSIGLYQKCSHLGMKEFTDILKIFYTEVHKKLILEGYGYAFSGKLGWICVNRCLITKKKKLLDYSATKKREQELIAKGAKIYNKEEADWCLRNGIEYKAEDKRVFMTNEYCYQIALLDCTIETSIPFVFSVSDYRHADYRGKTNDDLIAMCNGDINKICELSLDVKTKLTLCDKANKLLYTKFIRNETQSPHYIKNNHWKD